jgi:hypothetical protein
MFFMKLRIAVREWLWRMPWSDAWAYASVVVDGWRIRRGKRYPQYRWRAYRPENQEDDGECD